MCQRARPEKHVIESGPSSRSCNCKWLSHSFPGKPNSISKVSKGCSLNTVEQISGKFPASLKLSRNAEAGSARLPRARESPRLRACSRRSSLVLVEKHSEIVRPIVGVLLGRIHFFEVEHSGTELCLGVLPDAHPFPPPPMRLNIVSRSVRSRQPASSHGEIRWPIDGSLAVIQETSSVAHHRVSN